MENDAIAIAQELLNQRRQQAAFAASYSCETRNDDLFEDKSDGFFEHKSDLRNHDFFEALDEVTSEEWDDLLGTATGPVQPDTPGLHETLQQQHQELASTLAQHFVAPQYHWHQAKGMLEAHREMLGKGYRLMVGLFALGLAAQGRRKDPTQPVVLVETQWRLAQIIGVDPDYVGRILRELRPVLKRFTYYRPWATHHRGKSCWAGMLFVLPLPAPGSQQTYQPAPRRVKGTLASFQGNHRDLRKAVRARHTWLGVCERGMVMRNPRGKVRYRTLMDHLPEGTHYQHLEEACMVQKKTFQEEQGGKIRNIREQSFELLSLLEAPITRTMAVGWVRDVAAKAAALMRDEHRLQTWYKVLWRVVNACHAGEKHPRQHLVEAFFEVLIRSSDSQVHTPGALVMWKLKQLGFWNTSEAA